MKLMTLNAHSFSEPNRREKTENFCAFLREMRPDVVALQEVSQTRTAPAVKETSERLYRCGSVPLREDNDVLTLLHMTENRYYGVWLGVKIGYGNLDEGIGLLCRFPVSEVCEILLTPQIPYENWRRRSALTVYCAEYSAYFCSVHLSWWEDGFSSQWRELTRKTERLPSVWVMGDFNVPADRSELVTSDVFSEWYDAYRLADVRDDADTVLCGADGWRERPNQGDGLRIDQIRCRPAQKIVRYRRVLDGRKEPIVSDHFGVLIETEDNRNVGK